MIVWLHVTSGAASDDNDIGVSIVSPCCRLTPMRMMWMPLPSLMKHLTFSTAVVTTACAR